MPEMKLVPVPFRADVDPNAGLIQQPNIHMFTGTHIDRTFGAGAQMMQEMLSQAEDLRILSAERHL